MWGETIDVDEAFSLKSVFSKKHTSTWHIRTSH
jgi:hypothetical protein